MAAFVVDASVSLAWCFNDEATPWTNTLIERLRNGDRVIVPAHWPLEISNSLLVAVRRKRIPDQRPDSFLNELSILPIVPEPPLTSTQSASVLGLAKKHNLTSYDAAYLELALRLHLPLATLDTDLRKAAQAENLKLL